jgi:hypothetical protein
MSLRDVYFCFSIVRSAAGRIDPQAGRFELGLGCPVAEKEHRQADRQYMHVGCQPGVVCCARAAGSLSRSNLLGLFLHEFGHVLGGPQQWQADVAAYEIFGVPIRYDRRGVQFMR